MIDSCTPRIVTGQLPPHFPAGPPDEGGPLWKWRVCKSPAACRRFPAPPRRDRSR